MSDTDNAAVATEAAAVVAPEVEATPAAAAAEKVEEVKEDAPAEVEAKTPVSNPLREGSSKWIKGKASCAHTHTLAVAWHSGFENAYFASFLRATFRNSHVGAGSIPHGLLRYLRKTSECPKKSGPSRDPSRQ